MRRLFIIIIIFLLVISASILGYAYLRRAPVEQKKADEAAEPPPQETKKVLAEGVISAVPSFNGERVWYLTSAGKIFSINLETDARDEFILPEAVKNPTRVLWQEKGSDLVVEQNLGGHIRYTYVDAKNKTLAEYPDNIRTPVILAGDTRIAYDWVSDKHELKVADINSANFSAVGDLFQPDYVFTAHSRKSEIVMYATASTSPLVHVDLDKKEFKNLAADGKYLNVRFSPDGSKLLVREDKLEAVLFWVYDFGTAKKTDLDIGEAEFAIWTRDSTGVMFAESGALKEASLRSSEVKEWGSFPGQAVKDAFLHPFKDVLFYIDETGKLYSQDL